MALTPGQTLLHYRLVERIGEGGMGVVWKALDTDLDREVAIKVLPESFIATPDRLARFEREARLLASLRHPNIAVVHGLHTVDATRFLVMELLPGKDLQQRMTLGKLPLDEVIEIARQIAGALEAAHEQGVIHRDLKPANVIVCPDGTIKVVDFGLAKSTDAEPGEPDLSHSPTLTHAGTTAGMILGTAGYMSPEQAKGRVVDRRADIWAFGVLLYEMLTSARLYDEETVSEAIAAVLMKDPDWERLPADTPRPLRQLLHRCLTKDARSRLRDIGEARITLEQPLPVDDGQSTESPTQSESRPRPLIWVATALVAGLLLGIGVSRLLGPTPPAATTSTSLHLSIVPPEKVRAVSNPVVSPDGRTVVYRGQGIGFGRLYRRDLISGATAIIAGTDGGGTPFFSPDGGWVGFFTGDALKKIRLSGGEPLEILEISRDSPGATWLDDGRILYSPGWLTGLALISDEGGTPDPVTTPDTEAGEIAHWWPEPLPDQRHVLFTIWTQGEGLNDARIGVLDLESRQWTTLMQGARAQFAAPDRLVFYRAGSYQWVRFDPESRTVIGEPVPLDLPIAKQYPHGSNRNPLTFGPGGMLVYEPGESLFPLRRMVWVDRGGQVTEINDANLPIYAVSLAPDDRTLATVELVGGRFAIFMHDLERGTRDQLALDGSVFQPKWSPDSRRFGFAALRHGSFDVFVARPDGSDEQVLLSTPADETPLQWFSDSRHLLVQQSGKGELELSALDTADGEFDETLIDHELEGGRMSPDDRWSAFVDNSSGRNQVYVRSVKDPGSRVRVSAAGGAEPRWCPSANELFYFRGEEAVVASYSLEGDTFVPGPERVLFRSPVVTGTSGTTWDVTSDCQRFVLLRPGASTPSRPELRVVYNWPAAD